MQPWLVDDDDDDDDDDIIIIVIILITMSCSEPKHHREVSWFTFLTNLHSCHQMKKA
jgi:hypothetical protein